MTRKLVLTYCHHSISTILHVSQLRTN